MYFCLVSVSNYKERKSPIVPTQISLVQYFRVLDFPCAFCSLGLMSTQRVELWKTLPNSGESSPHEFLFRCETPLYMSEIHMGIQPVQLHPVFAKSLVAFLMA